jgi:hypothetical protein
MKSKSDSFSCFKFFCAFFEKINNHNIKSLCTNNGGEYISKEIEKYLESASYLKEPARNLTKGVERPFSSCIYLTKTAVIYEILKRDLSSNLGMLPSLI